MNDQSGTWPSLLNRHVQRVANQFGKHARRHGPADHFARERVNQHRQVHPPGAGADVGDIRDIGHVRR